jgi:hypothetical protein
MATPSYIKYGDFSFKGASGYPVPSISISKEQQRDGAGKAIGATVTITLEGQIYSGSGVTAFNNLLILESGLRNTFSIDGQNLTIGCGDNTSTTNIVYSGIKISKYGASKTDNNWTSTIDYSIELQSEVKDASNSIFHVSQTQDDYTIETIDEYNWTARSPLILGSLGFGSPKYDAGLAYPLYRITRTLGAVGKFIPTGTGIGGSGLSAVSGAKDWVNFHLSQTPKYTGVIDKGLTLYNFVRSINVSDTEGSYKITDTWLGMPGNALGYIETFSVENTLDNTMLRTVVINGSIKGLEPFQSGNIYDTNSVTYITGGLSGSLATLHNSFTKNDKDYNNKFIAAISGYSGVKIEMLNRANSFANTGDRSFFPPLFKDQFKSDRNRPNGYENAMNPIPFNIQEGFNPSEGTVTYSWTFNNRPINLIPGSISETLTVEDTSAIPVIASIFVLGRKLGPILQDLGTITAASRNVTFEVIFPRPTGLKNLAFPIEHFNAVTGAVEAFNPGNMSYNPINGGVKSYIKQDSSTWNPSEGRFTKIKGWEWIRCITD